MSRLPSSTSVPAADLAGLDGIGKKLKKLHKASQKLSLSRKAVGEKRHDNISKAVGAAFALYFTAGQAAPLLKAAHDADKARRIQKREGPGGGVEYVDENGKPITKAQYDAAMAALAAEQAAAPAAPSNVVPFVPANSGGGSGSSYSAPEPRASAARDAATDSSTAAPAADAAKKPNYLGWAAGGVLAVKLLGLLG